MAQNRNLSGQSIFAAIVAFLLLCTAGGALLAATAIPFTAASGTAANAVTATFETLPSKIDFAHPSEQSTLYSADGQKIASFYSENRVIVDSSQISPFIKNAAVAIEDQRFYQHHGLDVKGVVGAVINNASGNAIAGGSTITQQFVKNTLLEEGRIAGNTDQIAAATERSITRKLNEARYAVAVENKMSKDEILTGYLNVAQFGPSQWGVEAASQYFYGKHAKDVTLPQAAMLAGITQSPGKWNPVTNPELAKKRRDTVLAKMHELGMISEAQMREGIDTPIKDMLNITKSVNGCAAAGDNAYFCELVTKQLLDSPILGENRDERLSKLYRGGLQIYTTLDLTRQKAAYDAIVKQTPVDDPSSIEMALSSVEPGTGKIQAMVQNTRYGNPSNEDPDQTKLNLNVGEDLGGGAGYPGGSTFKAYTLVQWIKDGHSENDRVYSARQTFRKASWNIPCAPTYAADYSPGNLDGLGYARGNMSIKDIIRRSVNAGAVAMGNKENLCELDKTVSAMGLKRGELGRENSPSSNLTRKHRGDLVKVGEPLPLDLNPSMLLGSNTVTPLSQATAMATLAAEGKYCRPISFTKITDTDGKVIGTQEPECRQVLEKSVAQKATAVLKGVVAPGYTGSEAVLANNRPAAGKSGTANEDWAAWFIGYTPQLATAVWQGHMEGFISMFNTTINGVFNREVYGGLYPARAFKIYTDAALKDQPIQQFGTPPTTVSAPNTAENSALSNAPAKPAPKPSATPSPTPSTSAPAKNDAPKKEAPKKEAPKKEAPKKEAPKTHDPGTYSRRTNGNG
ncbi:transglycosylase domain-containing protein [Arcanobacterium wilhelmae]|uniref:transglycosylase domain-containing protein n=1 Tax=Arcanobacterium wilhelmae TaxID=1803177 RepID=UPI00241537EC|nr:transglycosylase domain-containing protein [Arcanobacterium wilhelmae]WFN90435.1 transglycosylase domain-containing protein [Arcanobacterium wilhelmae]